MSHGLFSVVLCQPSADISTTYRYKGMFYPKSQINCLLSLIFSLVVDLHLFYPNQVSQNHDEFVREVKVVCPSYHERWIRRNEPTKEEKRAILGSFCLFSTVRDSD